MDLRLVAWSRSSSSCNRRRLAVAVCCVSPPQVPAPVTATLPVHGLRPLGGRGGGLGLWAFGHRPRAGCRRTAVPVVVVPSPRRGASSPAIALLPVQAVRGVCVHVMAYAHVVSRSVPNDKPLDRPCPPGSPGGARSRPRFPVPLDWPGFPGSPGVHPGRLDTVPGGRRGSLSARRELTRADRLQRSPGQRNAAGSSILLQVGARNPVAACTTPRWAGAAGATRQRQEQIPGSIKPRGTRGRGPVSARRRSHRPAIQPW